MRLTAHQSAVLDACASEAHDRARCVEGYITHDAAVAFVEQVGDLDRFGQPWVEAFRTRLMLSGAKQYLASWRRRQRVESKTAKGTMAWLPAFVGKRARGQYVQVPLEGLDVLAAEAYIKRTTHTRDTLSKQIRLAADAVALCHATPGLTMSKALAQLRDAA